ncbi:MAG: phage portal protein [Candidatus Omnitrophica bacterium]|nr:phage portal protein [Candidatus Omnitrophota bacterium]
MSKDSVNAMVFKVNKRRSYSNRKEDPFRTGYSTGDIIEPPYNFYDLVKFVEMSSILPQAIDAMCQNCEGHGYNLIEAKMSKEDRTKYSADIAKERDSLDVFFDYCNYDMSFTALRKKLRNDYETIGNAWFEVLRNEEGRIDGFEYIKGITMRLGGLSKLMPIDVKRIKSDTWEYETTSRHKRFRTFVQIINEEKVYFKEFGDTRTMNAYTGEIVNENMIAEMQTRAVPYKPATEVIHLRQESGRSPYGLPRWISQVPSIAGSRAAEEVNLSHFDNKTVPPMVILVSGGKLNSTTVERIKEHIQNEAKGRGNYHAVLVIEAESANAGFGQQNDSARPRVDIKPLSQVNDAKFLEYDHDNRRKVRSSFRLPPIYTGETEDYTRATAIESRNVAEEQVFGPEKANFDFMINRKIFADMGVRFHTFETRSSPVDNRKDQTDITKVLSDTGALTINELRQLADRVVEIELDDVSASDIHTPVKLLERNNQQGDLFSTPKNGSDADLEKVYKGMLRLRRKLRASLRSGASRRRHGTVRESHLPLDDG